MRMVFFAGRPVGDIEPGDVDGLPRPPPAIARASVSASLMFAGGRWVELTDGGGGRFDGPGRLGGIVMDGMSRKKILL